MGGLVAFELCVRCSATAGLLRDDGINMGALSCSGCGVAAEKNMTVAISLFINRVSAVDESKEEISLEVFLQVYWTDRRIRMADNLSGVDHLELTWGKENDFWVPDLYIRQLREMKVLSLFQDMTSVRLYRNQTMRVSMGATVIIKCDMDFVLYPLDVQECAVDFSSCLFGKTTLPSASPATSVTATDSPSTSCPSSRRNKTHNVYYGEVLHAIKDSYQFGFSVSTSDYFHGPFFVDSAGNHSTARMKITMSREIRSHLLETYLPSSLFVIMSWGGFCVIPEVVPGRMVLLVTTLLSLVTMFDTVRNNSPSALELKCIEVWLISCTLFVFFALLEYFIVLFGIRYDKHWRHKKRDLEMQLQPPNHVAAPPDKASRLRLFGTSKVHPQHHARLAKNGPSSDQLQGVELSEWHPNSVYLCLNKVWSSSLNLCQENNTEAGQSEAEQKPRLRAVTEYIILYCGSQRGTLDQVSLALFPLSFLVFTVVYWVTYLNEAKRRDAV
ncbi:glycine receptor subunit beta-type 4-like [Homalodisca vitripennis]|uniref:glycine receptor subunit beta-type 4-like n=1 Tax=Homalodisca vitripennis TaxID=197043 RepID=UPI001EEB35B3|nr:glycine receptor subunit beta-type 4-like [Homalodisca vitripennis]